MNDNRVLSDVDVLVMSAGAGLRMGGEVRKQWLPLCGRPLFVYTVGRLADMGFRRVVVVVHPNDEMAAREALDRSGLSRVALGVGGKTRQASVFRGLDMTTGEFVAIHDAARPFVEPQDVLAVVQKARESGAATLGAPVRDTLKRVAEQGRIIETLPRDGVWQVQTPQVFRREWLLAAHRRAVQDSRPATDDAALMEYFGYPVSVVAGSAWNVKITGPEDRQFMQMWEASR